MFNKERFHNELAMQLVYERIVKDKRILISVDGAPWVTLKVQGHEDIRFKASGNCETIDSTAWTGMNDEIRKISDAVHQAYIIANNSRF